MRTRISSTSPATETVNAILYSNLKFCAGRLANLHWFVSRATRQVIKLYKRHIISLVEAVGGNGMKLKYVKLWGVKYVGDGDIEDGESEFKQANIVGV